MRKIIFLVSLLICVSSVVMADLNSAEVINNVVARSGSIQSYRTIMSLVDFTQPEKDRKDFTVQWKAEYIKPDKFSVSQSAWDKNENLYDRWISIGVKTYFQTGSWFEGSDRKATNDYLTPDKWVHLIQDGKILSVKNEENTIMVEVAPATLKYFHFAELKKTVICNAKVQIDPVSFYIVKASLRVEGENSSGKVDLVSEQTFIDYNAKITIEKPAEVMNLGK